jgi:hypothetical protein
MPRREKGGPSPRRSYDLLMKASAETTLAIAADPKHLGARIGSRIIPTCT